MMRALLLSLALALVTSGCLVEGPSQPSPTHTAPTSLHHVGDAKTMRGSRNPPAVNGTQPPSYPAEWTAHRVGQQTQDVWGASALVWHDRTVETQSPPEGQLTFTTEAWFRDSDASATQQSVHRQASWDPTLESWTNTTYLVPCAAPEFTVPGQAVTVHCVSDATTTTPTSQASHHVDRNDTYTWEGNETVQVAGGSYEAQRILHTDEHGHPLGRFWRADVGCGFRTTIRDADARGQYELAGIRCGSLLVGTIT